MAVEIGPLMQFLSRAEQERQRRQQEAAAQAPTQAAMPEWAMELNPDDFSGQTRALMLKARESSAPGTASQMGKSDLGLTPEQAAQTPPPDPIVDGINQAMAGAPGGVSGGYIEANRLGGASPYEGGGPTSGPQIPAQPPMLEPAAQMPQQQNTAPEPQQGAQSANLRKALGPLVGDRGDFINMARQARQTGELPGGGALSGGGGSDTLAGGPAQQPRGGGGMFGGGQGTPGMGRYLLGGFGALMSEAGGQQGAMGQYVQNFQEQHQKRAAEAQELARFNQTAQRALDMGIDPDYIMTMAETGDMKSLVGAIQDERKFMRDAEKPTDEMREYALYKEQGGTLPFFEFKRELKRSGATNVNVGQSEVGTIPQGYEMVTGPDGARSMRRIPGGPADEESQQSQQAQSLSMRSYEQKFNMVDNAITDVLEDTGFWTAGPAGAVLSNVPGTPAYDMGRTIETIKANLGFEELKAMRDSSPTGGALGQVTERELAFLQAAQGNLDQAQTPEQLRKVLTDIQTRRREFREARARAYEQDYGRPMPDMGTEVPAPGDEQGWQDMGNGIRVRRKQ